MLLRGRKCSTIGPHQNDAAMPIAPPKSASKRLSASICRTRRARPAPTEQRTANSRRRAAARASNIFATLAHEISKTPPTNPKSTGGYRAIHVDARAHGYGKLTVRTRSGYYAGQERASSGLH